MKTIMGHSSNNDNSNSKSNIFLANQGKTGMLQGRTRDMATFLAKKKTTVLIVLTMACSL